MKAILAAVLAAVPAAGGAPRIEHQPVAIAMEGQPLTIRARVVDESGPVRSVILYFAVSPDAAPYPVPMQPAGASLYVGTVSETVLAGIPGLSYYLEAIGASGISAETPWHRVEVRGAEPRPGVPEDSEPDRSKWATPAIIAGGSAAVIIGAVAAGRRRWDSDDPASGTAGAYFGTSTISYSPPTGPATLESKPFSIEIDDRGTIRSATLWEGETLQGRLSGSGFVLNAPISRPGGTGSVQFVGTVIDGRIAGTVQGSVTTPDGIGTYSGVFTASRQ